MHTLYTTALSNDYVASELLLEELNSSPNQMIKRLSRPVSC